MNSTMTEREMVCESLKLALALLQNMQENHIDLRITNRMGDIIDELVRLLPPVERS
jgi:hypothetical protein